MENQSISSQEEIVLLLVGALAPNAYAYTIKKEMLDQGGKNIALASIHTILYRLEKHNLLKSSMGGASSSRGGRSKRLYQLTMKGYKVVEDIHSFRNSLWGKISLDNIFSNS